MVTWQNKSALSAFFTAAFRSAKRATVEALTMPLGKKRKQMGFIGTPAWKKRKVDESSQSSCSLPCGQGTPELFNSNPSGQTSDSASVHYSASYRKILVKTVIVKMILNMGWMIPNMNLMASQQIKVVMPLLLAFD